MESIDFYLNYVHSILITRDSCNRVMCPALIRPVCVSCRVNFQKNQLSQYGTHKLQHRTGTHVVLYRDGTALYHDVSGHNITILHPYNDMCISSTSILYLIE